MTTTMPADSFEWHNLVTVDPPPGPPTPGVEYPDLTVMVPEPTEAISQSLAGHWTRRNLVSGDESWSTVHGSASRAETIGITTGDATITGAAGTFEEWDPGAPITGTGIPAGTTILSVTSDTSAEMSANATATNAAAALTIGLHGVYVSTLSAGEGYLTPCPSGDFEVIALVSRTIPISDRMIGPWIVDSATGHGVLGSWYSSPQSWLTLRSTGWTYTGGFTQGSNVNMPQATTALKLRKSGTNYYTSYSLDYGATWSAETPAQAWTGTPTHMGFGCILGASQATKWHEFYPGPTEPEDEPEIPGEDLPPYDEWQADEDRSAGLVSIGVTYGARDAVTKPGPLVSDVELAGQVAGDCPQVGERFRLVLSEDARTALGLTEPEGALFTGEVTDPVIDPVRGVHRIGAAGKLGRANRRTLIASEWPSEDDGDRTARILAAAAMETGTVDPGTVTLAAPDQDDTAGAMLDQVTDSTGGAVVEQPDGPVDYHDADHRRGGTVVMTLNPSQILNSITWEQHVDDVLNEIEVTYSGGVVKVREPGSIEAHHGVYPGRRSTVLTTHSDAHSLGQLVVARRSEPRWQLPDLEIDLMHTLVDDATRGDLLKLRHGDRILITDVPGPHPYSGDVEFNVEGWRQTVTRPAQGVPWRWRMVLSVSDPALSGVSIRWMDFEAGYAWEDLPVGLSWLDLARIEEFSDL